MVIIPGNKYYKNNQIVVPKEIREELKLNEMDNEDIVVDWIKEGDDIRIKFRKRRKLQELEGLIKLGYKTNSVDLKKELYE